MRRRKGSVLLSVLLAVSALAMLILGSVSPILLLRKQMKMAEKNHDKEFQELFAPKALAQKQTLGTLEESETTEPSTR